MNIKSSYFAVASTLIVFAGCSDDSIVKSVTPWNEGDEITFNIRAGFENKDKAEGRSSRTVYTGQDYEVDGKTYERVDWVNGDKVRIYCEQASIPLSENHWSDYQVSQHENTDTQKDYATLERLSSETGSLQWGNPNQDHTFYAIYPSPMQNNLAGIEKNVVTGTIPSAQEPIGITETVEGENTVYTYKPNMNYAYMTAKYTAPANGDRNVRLSFQSIATVLELEIIGTDYENLSTNVTLTDIIISSETENINGGFTCNLDQVGEDGYPVCELSTSTDARNQINISLIKDGKGIEMSKGKTIRLTAFLLPVDNLSDLKLTLVGLNGRKTHAFVNSDNSNMVIKAHLKHLVHSIHLPDKEMDSSSWLSQLNEHVLLSQLSIPGTNASYSYNYGEDDNSKYYKAQELDIEQQWNLGIRCFEITCDRTESTTGGNLGNQNISTSVSGTIGRTVAEAVEKIREQLMNNDQEFALIIISYQPTFSRDCNDFIRDFVTYYESLKNEGVKMKLFSPGMTIGDARGSIMFIVRPSSDGEDFLNDATKEMIKDMDFVSIEGWGSLQDKWKHRGYPVSTNNGHPNDKGKTSQTVGAMEYYMLMENMSETSAPNNFRDLPQKGMANYTYQTNTNFSAWVQEWPRVVKKDFNKKINNCTENNTYYYLWVQWKESYNEKLSDAKLTFNKAIDDKQNTSSIYINSLAGYYIDESIEEKGEAYRQQSPAYVYIGDESTHQYENWGGNYGNLEEFSDQINKDFYQYVLEKAEMKDGTVGVTGPMGIVLMNRVGIETVPGSMYMPNVVISNNFKFPLLTDTSTGSETGPTPANNGNTYSSGGNAIK